MISKTRNSNTTVNIVILNWNGADVTYECLDSIAKQTTQVSEVIVVDNGSVDGSCEYIAKHYPNVTLLRQPKNLGFAGGVNVGIKAATGDYVMLLNNDATLAPDCVEQLIITATKHKSDITQAVILTDSGKLIDSVGDKFSIWGLPFPGKRNSSASDVPKQDEKIFSACGGASLYKKSLLEEIGLFDDMFFAYYEDVDISMRAQLKGKQLWLSSKAIVQHKMNHTSNKMPGFGREMSIKNSIYVYWKNIPFPLIVKMFPRIVYCNWRITASAIVHGHPVRALRAQLVALLHTPHLIIRRHKIQSSKKLSSIEFENLLSKENPFKVNKPQK